MSRKTRLSVILMLIVHGGCYQRASNVTPVLPVLPPIDRITARVHELPAFRLPAIETVSVPGDQLSSFAKLITPVGPCQIDVKMNYSIADVFVHHKDGTTSTLLIRWTGHNPAAITFDDKTYFFGGTDEFPDGATRILRLLRKYDFDSREKK